MRLVCNVCGAAAELTMRLSSKIRLSILGTDTLKIRLVRIRISSQAKSSRRNLRNLRGYERVVIYEDTLFACYCRQRVNLGLAGSVERRWLMLVN